MLQIPGVTHFFSDWLEPTVYGGVPMLEPSTSKDWIATVVATSAGLIGILAARALGRRAARTRCRSRAALAILSERKFYWDELYHYAFYVPGRWLSVTLRRTVERSCSLLAPDALGPLAVPPAAAFAVVQTGLVRGLRLVFALGVAGARLLLHGAGRLMFDAYTVNPRR